MENNFYKNKFKFKFYPLFQLEVVDLLLQSKEENDNGDQKVPE